MMEILLTEGAIRVPGGSNLDVSLCPSATRVRRGLVHRVNHVSKMAESTPWDDVAIWLPMTVFDYKKHKAVCIYMCTRILFPLFHQYIYFSIKWDFSLLFLTLRI